jgi:hypothetical protein
MASGDGPRFYVGYGEMTQITHAFVPSNHDSSIHLQRSMCTLGFHWGKKCYLFQITACRTTRSFLLAATPQIKAHDLLEIYLRYMYCQLQHVGQQEYLQYPRELELYSSQTFLLGDPLRSLLDFSP